MTQELGETVHIRSEVIEFCKGKGLDLGCGGVKICPEAWGFDLPTPYTDLKFTPIELKGDARQLPVNNGVLDYVYSSHLLEDFTNTFDVMFEWTRVLKKGGYLILYLPNQKIFKAFCEKRGWGDNLNHRIDEMSLEYIRKTAIHLPLEEVKSIEHHMAYSFLIVFRKTS